MTLAGHAIRIGKVAVFLITMPIMAAGFVILALMALVIVVSVILALYSFAYESHFGYFGTPKWVKNVTGVSVEEPVNSVSCEYAFGYWQPLVGSLTVVELPEDLFHQFAVRHEAGSQYPKRNWYQEGEEFLAWEDMKGKELSHLMESAVLDLDRVYDLSECNRSLSGQFRSQVLDSLNQQKGYVAMYYSKPSSCSSYEHCRVIHQSLYVLSPEHSRLYLLE